MWTTTCVTGGAGLSVVPAGDLMSDTDLVPPVK
jgi:hypothetical protein